MTNLDILLLTCILSLLFILYSISVMKEFTEDILKNKKGK